MPESGSGPGGRRFKSSLPDHSFQRLKNQKSQPWAEGLQLGVYIDLLELTPKQGVVP